MLAWMDRQFQLSERKTNVRTEVLAGITTFMTMSYIIFVNPDILSATGMPFDSLLMATCLSAAFATFLMAFMANYPVALAPGMGLNAFFAFSVVLTMKVPWQVALAAIFVEGIIFILLTLTKVRESIVNGIPESLKYAISAGIGLFIAFIGMQGAGIIVKHDATLVTLGDFSFSNMPALLAFMGVIVIGALEFRQVKGAILWGIIAVAGGAMLLGIAPLPTGFISSPPSIAPIFNKMDFSALNYAASPENFWNFWIVVFTFFFVDFFDTVGTLIGVTGRAGLLDEKGHLPRARGALLADAIGTTAGAIMGTSTVTSFVESASGVEAGGKTGLTAVTTAFCFLLAIFFTPLVKAVPSYATAPALIFVGIYMMMSVRNIDFLDLTELVPSAVAIFMMPFAYSISAGIEFGFITYVGVKFLAGRSKDVSPLMWVLGIIFVLKELFM